MWKLKLLLKPKRIHFKNRLRQRHGNVLYFLFAKPIDNRPVDDKSKGKCIVWRYKNHIFFTQNNRLQTYINKRQKVIHKQGLAIKYNQAYD